ncbi:FAD-dependent oxidoreductase [Spirochaetia bacterium]|nr:FAD-dependent oxidoreductase [Spirochaetia bacterium]
MNKIVIVGAGIAGFTAGIYAQKSGFDVTIYEGGNVPGGNCTSWRRKGYLFEGGMHWLTGSGAEQPLCRVLHEVGALTGGTKVVNVDPFMICDWHGQQVCLYRDVERLEAHLNAVSPEDRTQIRQLCRDIARFSGFSMPVMDIPGLKVTEKSPSVIKAVFKMMPALSRVVALCKLSAAEYAALFKHPAIRLLLSSVIEPSFDSLSLLATLGCFAAGDGGYIEGGSLVLASNMAKRFKGLGGVVRYGKKVERVRISDGMVCGVVVEGEPVSARAVIVASDTLQAVDSLFDPPLQEKWTLALREKTKRSGALLMCTFIGIGVEADLSGSPKGVMFPLKTPFEYAGRLITSLGYNQYSGHAAYAPPDCTAITIILAGDTYDYWKQAHEQGCYVARKEELFAQVLPALEEQLPAIRGKLAVWDMATPLTYERYCGTYHGSWMTITLPRTKRVSYPCKSKYASRLYFAGQRIMPPGGIPVAVSTGRTAAQHLCRDFGTVFRS